MPEKHGNGVQKGKCVALVRRAHWLEKRLAMRGVPGQLYDAAEYNDLLWVFEELGIPYTPEEVEAAPVMRTARPVARPRHSGEEPPVRPDDGDTFIPGEPRGRRYVPGGF